ncbi:DDB1- and CUL4-associated factor 10 homolog isoform X1 [Zeugodacus cucurbitae]|uniref:DDB1- and CUL4-associated factor 10 homolog isoform X1 n=1 Tax=Zeugodacus cucurbitae TaxID=28588 RepID=UPI0023D95568|nr:DDB1- and CUL4-associated factor 10 homolog isoform X1 [Zeugodacus cucurbitae]XP_011192890.2 DDB1- and CUL4-associated factor 10 homolog isoform X1 [Zeugodacus cucurbitae]
MSFHSWLLRRENGLLRSQADQDFIMPRIYQSMRPLYQWNDKFSKSGTNLGTVNVGGVFNMEFSPEGNLLVAACERKAIVMFDVISRQTVQRIMDAHTSNVNCIKFLNSRHFATCSDDTTVALWDLRFLKTKMRSLQGHSNWVKSIEYSKQDSLLVTSAFDGSIFTWDINSYTEQGLIYQKVFHTSGLMRCRITPDGSKLILCTTGGYIMIVHDLDLTTLHKDLCGFRPIIYRLMQMGKQYIPQAAKFDHVFSKKQKKNRVELVTDFPKENDAEVILALEVHPRGHCFLSRNISYDGITEWLTVHDMAEESDDVTESIKKHNNDTNKRKRKRESDTDKEDNGSEPSPPASGSHGTNDDVVFSINRRTRATRLAAQSARSAGTPSGSAGSGNADGSSNSNNNANANTFVPDIWAAEVTMQDRATRQNRGRENNSTNVYNFVYAISSGVLPAGAVNSTPSTLPMSRNSGLRFVRGYDIQVSSDDSSSSSDESTPRIQSSNVQHLLPSELSPAVLRASRNHSDGKIFQNPNKLTYYIKELNKEKTFIKEPCFSADGRIICSPYATGVRLLGFSKDCSVYPHHSNYSSSKRNPQPLSEIITMRAHSDIVLSTRFSPREPLLVTGCRSGKIVWYQPNL